MVSMIDCGLERSEPWSGHTIGYEYLYLLFHSYARSIEEYEQRLIDSESG